MKLPYIRHSFLRPSSPSLLMRFRKLLFWIHLIAGVVTGLVVGIMCVTGTAIAFEKELIAWAARDARQADPSAGPAMEVEALLARIAQESPETEITALVFDKDPGTVVIARAGRQEALYVDPYSGELREPGAAGMRRFMQVMTAWHRWLGTEGDSRPIGKAITGASNLAFLVLLLTGLYLWVPRQWSKRALRPILWFVKGAKGKARDWNWHNVLGLWTAPVMLVIIVSGVVISYPWASNLVYQLAGEEPPQGRGGPGGPAGDRPLVEPPPGVEKLAYSALLQHAQQAVPRWQQITLSIDNPAAPLRRPGPGRGQAGAEASRGGGEGKRGPRETGAAAVSIAVKESGGWPLFALAQISLNPYTGEVLTASRFQDQSPGRQVRSWLRFLHTGEAFGFWGKFIAAVVSLAGGVLVWTGFAMALNRLRRWLKRRRYPQA